MKKLKNKHHMQYESIKEFNKLFINLNINELLEIIISIFLISLMFIYFFKFSNLSSVIETIVIVSVIVFIYCIPKKLMALKLRYEFEYKIWIEGFILLSLLLVITNAIVIPPFTEKVKNLDVNKNKLYKIGIIGPIILLGLSLICLRFSNYPLVNLLAKISLTYAFSNTILCILNFDGAKILGVKLENLIYDTIIGDFKNTSFNWSYIIILILIIGLFSWLVYDMGTLKYIIQSL